MGSLLRFVNAVADAIAEEFPPQADSGRRYIDTLAYRYTRTAPSITRPRDNVIIRLCSIECCFSHPIDRCSVVYRSPGIGVVDNAAFVRDMEAWSRIAPNLHIWDYVTNFHYYLAPHANIHVFAGNMRYFARNHTIGVYPEGAPDVRGSDMAELKAYLLAKLQWDLDYDVETGMDEFVRAYCGAGAGPILRYIRELNALPEREGHHMCCYEPPTRSFFTPDFMAFAEAMFDEAQRLAENEQVLQRIRYWRMSLRFIRLLLYAGEMSREALDAEHASFFADMNTFGIKALREGGTFESARAMLSPR